MGMQYKTGDGRPSFIRYVLLLVGMGLLLGCRSPEVVGVDPLATPSPEIIAKTICKGCCARGFKAPRLWTEEDKSLGPLQVDINKSDIIAMGVLTAAAPAAIQFEYDGGSYRMAISFTLEIEEWFGSKRYEHWFDFNTIQVLADYCDEEHWKPHPTAEAAVATIQSIMETNPPALDPSQRRVFLLRELDSGLYAGLLSPLTNTFNLPITDWIFEVDEALTHFRYYNDLDNIWEEVNLDDFREMVQDS